jgi:hypothetical protein
MALLVAPMILVSLRRLTGRNRYPYPASEGAP